LILSGAGPLNAKRSENLVLTFGAGGGGGGVLIGGGACDMHLTEKLTFLLQNWEEGVVVVRRETTGVAMKTEEAAMWNACEAVVIVVVDGGC
jgi:hypothetical protein